MRKKRQWRWREQERERECARKREDVIGSGRKR